MTDPLPSARVWRSWVRRAAPWAIALVAIALVLVVRACATTAPLDRLARGGVGDGEPAGARVWTGSLTLPRGGPYVIGFQSAGPATLTLTGADLAAPVVIAGRGVVTRRVLLGAHAPGAPSDGAVADPAPRATAVDLRLVAAGGVRLLWLPPGRRGEPEYVPAGALSAAPASAAPMGVDRSRGDAAAALAIVLIVVGLAGWLARHRLRAVPRVIMVGALAVLAVALVLRLESLGDAGQTWDEDTYWSAGRNYVDNLLRGDTGQDAWQWNYQHPPVTKYLAGLGAWWTDGYGPARAVSALVLALACALLVPIGARLHRPATGIAAGLIAALTPHLIAHGQIVGHEAPTALAWALALWTSLRVWDGIASFDSGLADARPSLRTNGTSLPGSGSGPFDSGLADARPSLRTNGTSLSGSASGADEASIRRRLIARLAVVGVVLGIGVMIRFVNVLAAPAIGLTIVLGAPRGRRVQAIALGLAVIPAVAALTSIALWPRLWSHPIAHLEQAWDKLKGTHSAEPFLGRLTATPPRWYFLAYLGATAPLGLALAAIVGKLAWLRDRARWRGLLIVAAWAAAPLGVMFSPVRQDGVRYVIPTLLMLAMLAGAGAVALGELVARRWSRPPWLRAIPTGLLVAYLLVVCVRIRPYYLDYYGEQVGGTAAVARSRRFEVAWWGEGLQSAIGYVNRHAGPGDRVHRGCVEPVHLTWFRGDLWEPVADPRAARWLVHYQPSWRPCPVPAGAVAVFTARAGGAPLALVYRIDPPALDASP